PRASSLGRRSPQPPPPPLPPASPCPRRLERRAGDRAGRRTARRRRQTSRRCSLDVSPPRSEATLHLPSIVSPKKPALRGFMARLARCSRLGVPNLVSQLGERAAGESRNVDLGEPDLASDARLAHSLERGG